MIKNREELKSYRQTVQKIFSMAKAFKNDLDFYVGFSPEKMFQIVSNLDFAPDPPNEETISRPKFTLDPIYFPRDCDDKTLILASYAVLKKIPYRLAVIGQNTRPHHIYPEFFLENKWISFDATFPEMEIGKLKYIENFREIYYP